MWDLPRPGLEPVSPALAGGFLTTEPPGKSHPLDSFFHPFCVLDPLSSSFLVDFLVFCGEHFPGTSWERVHRGKNLCISENVFILLLHLISFICGHFSYSFCPWGFMSVNSFTIISVEFWEGVEINIDNRVKISPTFQCLFLLLNSAPPPNTPQF